MGLVRSLWARASPRCSRHAARNDLRPAHRGRRGNTESARESGIRVDHIKIWCFVLCALLGGLIGILDGYHLGSLDPATDGLTFMFYGVTSAVIGGTALTGGRGTMIGACIGACVLGMIKDGFLILGTSSFALDLVTGLTILIAMTSMCRSSWLLPGEGREGRSPAP